MGLLIKLQNGDTALKSLKFGQDRPGGGNSGQPYIQNPLIDEPGKLAIGDDDFILRGGLRAPVNAAEDVARLTKYMFDFKNPKGLLFIAKQNILSRTAVPNEASQKWGINGPGAGYAGGALNEGVYTPISTLAQAGVGFLGIHLNKQGIDPTGLIPPLSLKKYEDVVREKNKKEFNTLFVNAPIGNIALAVSIAENPLIQGFNPFAQTNNLQGNFNEIANVPGFNNRLLSLWYDKGFTKHETPIILDYGGGPGSILGIGKTKIFFADDQRTGVNNKYFTSNKKFFLKGGKTSPTQYIVTDEDGFQKFTNELNYNKLLGASIKQGLTEYETGIEPSGLITNLYGPNYPYATLSKENPTGYSLTGSDGYQANKLFKNLTQETDLTLSSPLTTKLEEAGYSLGDEEKLQFDQEQRSFVIPNIENRATRFKDFGGGEATLEKSSTIPNRLDKKNLYQPVTKSVGGGTALDKIYYGDNSTRESTDPFGVNYDDIIPFQIGIVTATKGVQTTTLQFRAYLDNFSDNYSAGWTDVSYMGRAEKFHRYESFDRDISFGFTVVVDNKKHLKTMYQKLNLLASSLAPSYTTQGYMTGNLHKLTIGKYVDGLYGIIKGINYEVTDETPYDIDEKVPMYIKVSGIKFTPIHNFRPEYKKHFISYS